MSKIENRINELKPWRYNHTNGQHKIVGDLGDHLTKYYALAIYKKIVEKIVGDRDISKLRILDLGCLEGHYSMLFASLGFEEVVAIDLSESHVERVRFLANDFHGFSNVTAVHGNVLDRELIRSLGDFDIIFNSGLLYHLRDPILMIQIIAESLRNRSGHLVLFTQFKGEFMKMIADEPLAELQIKPNEPGVDESYDLSSVDTVTHVKTQATHEPIAVRINPTALYEVLKYFGFSRLIYADTPYGTRSFRVNLIAGPNAGQEMIQRLNQPSDIPGLRFAAWRKGEINSFRYMDHGSVRFLKATERALQKVASRVRTRMRRIRFTE